VRAAAKSVSGSTAAHFSDCAMTPLLFLVIRSDCGGMADSAQGVATTLDLARAKAVVDRVASATGRVS
jgi:hypothetical protein